MSNLNWKYVEPLKDGSEVDVIELKYHYKLPQDLKDCLVKNNAGVPSPCTFDLGENKGKVFGGLLSFNEGDADNIYDYIDMFMSADKKGLKMFPFGLDPAGNFLCVKEGAVVLYNHETDSTIPVCDTFAQFLSILY